MQRQNGKRARVWDEYVRQAFGFLEAYYRLERIYILSKRAPSGYPTMRTGYFAGAIWLVLAACFRSLAAYWPDDAYIHLRIARNLALYGTPYFNVDEAVLATSAPLWMLIESLFHFLRVPIDWGVPLLEASACVGTCHALSAIVRTRITNSLAALCAVWTITLGTLCTSAAQGMETPLAMYLVASGLKASLENKPSAIVWLTLSVFLRLECAAFLLTALCYGAYRARTSPTRWARHTLLQVGTIAAPIVIFLLAAYGTVLPNTVIAKDVLYDVSTNELAFLTASELSTKPLFYLFPLAAFALVAITAAALCGVLALLRWQPGRPLFTVFVLPAVLVLATYFAKGILLFPWYTPLYSLPLLFAGLCAMCRQPLPLRLLGFAALLGAPLVRLGQDLGGGFYDRSFFTEFENGAKARHYLEVGQALAERYPKAVVLAPEIGALGWKFPGRIVDAAGLASPEALRFHQSIPDEQKGMHGAAPVPFIEVTKPDIVVGLDLMLAAFIRSPLRAAFRWERQQVFLNDDRAAAGVTRYQHSDYLNIFVREGVFTSLLPQSSAVAG